MTTKNAPKQLLSADEAVRAKWRKSIPENPQVTVSLWSIMKNCTLNKELTKIPIPVNFNEPLSVCQRISEDLEYAHFLLDKAAMCRDSSELCYMAAYADDETLHPMLDETYECDRSSDLGWQNHHLSFCLQHDEVSHHAPITALHAEGMRKDWTVFQDITMTSKFRGKYLPVNGGNVHVIFGGKAKDGGFAGHTYTKITTTVHNIIVGKLWIDNHGEMHILNHANGDRGMVRFHAYNYFSSGKSRRLSDMVRDASGNASSSTGTGTASVALKQIMKLPDVQHNEEEGWANGVSNKGKVGLELSSARQHSQLEETAFGKSNAIGIDHPSYTKGEEDKEFHDAANDFDVPKLSLRENSAE